MEASKLDIESRRRVFAWLLGIMFLVLTARLAQLQILQHERYFRQSEQNRVRVVTLEPPRGQIFDRNGRLLVDNAPGYSLALLPYQYRGRDSLLAVLSRTIGLDVDEVRRRIRRNYRGEFQPVKIKRDLSFSLLAQLQERWLDFPGLVIETEPKRKYVGSSRLAHVLGYLGEITDRELKRLKDQGYRPGDLIGKTGLEKAYDRVLRGRRGYQYVEVDALGREIRTLPEEKGRPPYPGLNLILSIDDRLQAKLEDVLRGRRAAGVFLDPRNGEVLAMASSPDYRLEWFTGILDPSIWDSLLSDPRKPLLNRAVQGAYPPGSTFKLVTALAGLNEGIFRPSSRVTCTGALVYGGRVFACWFGKGHGSLDLYGAIEHSCNVYFYTMGLRVGLDLWARYSRLLGFGRRTGIDLPTERAGLIPDVAYLNRRYGEHGWTRGIMLNLAIGQGDLLTTPLQLAQFAMILANRGRGYVPHLVRAVGNPFTRQEMPARVDSFRIEGIPPEVFDEVREGMWRVVNGPGGTGRACYFEDLAVAGKTGTAQNPHGKPHAWFIGFAPYEAPEVAFCVFVENGGGGSVAAAPLAREVLRFYFDVVRSAAAEDVVDAGAALRMRLGIGGTWR